MRLLTYQQLCCVRKGCDHEYPLSLHINTKNTQSVQQTDSNVSNKFVHNMLNNLDYNLIQKISTQQLGIQLPSTIPQEIDSNFIDTLHHVIYDIHINDGYLQCNKCQRKYPIQSGIPNMRLNEDEV